MLMLLEGRLEHLSIKALKKESSCFRNNFGKGSSGENAE